MAEEKSKLNLVNILLSVISGLLIFFGTITVNVLTDMRNGLAIVTIENAVQNNRIDALENKTRQVDGVIQPMQKVYAKHEELFDLKNLK